jgi:hypothetical protein
MLPLGKQCHRLLLLLLALPSRGGAPLARLPLLVLDGSPLS